MPRGRAYQGAMRVNPIKDNLIMLSEPYSPVAESFRTLRSNLMRSVDQGVRRIVFLSPWAGEGKSIVCANLAVAFAQIGKTVLLADLDLRRPTLAGLFKLGETMGVTNVLKKECALDSIIVETGVPNLKFAPCGPMTSNPADLLSGADFSTLVAELGSRAEMLLIDTPPLSLFSEGLLLSSLADGVVLIISPRHWKGEQEVEIKKSLEEHGAKILGIILNRVEDAIGAGYGSYGYGYLNNPL
jgi:protein-tyrosine kinase